MTIPSHVHILNPTEYKLKSGTCIIAKIIQIKSGLIQAADIYNNKVYNIDYISEGLTSPRINKIILLSISNRKNILLNYLTTTENFKAIELINETKLEQICNNLIAQALKPFISFKDKFTDWFKSNNGKLEIHNEDGIDLKSGNIAITLHSNGHLETNAKIVTTTADSKYKINAKKIELN